MRSGDGTGADADSRSFRPARGADRCVGPPYEGIPGVDPLAEASRLSRRSCLAVLVHSHHLVAFVSSWCLASWMLSQCDRQVGPQPSPACALRRSLFRLVVRFPRSVPRPLGSRIRQVELDMW